VTKRSRLEEVERVLAKYEPELFSSLWTQEWATDPLSALIRGLIYVDYYLSVMLERNLPNPEVLDLGKRAYNIKLRLARALGLVDEGLYGALMTFAEVRNELAHDLERTHDPEKLGRLELALSGRARLFMGYITGGSSRANQRLRHAIQAYVMAVEEIAYPERRYGVVGILELKPGAGADGSELLDRATCIKKLYDEGEFDSILDRELKYDVVEGEGFPNPDSSG
jgi:hypothetical protein